MIPKQFALPYKIFMFNELPTSKKPVILGLTERLKELQLHYRERNHSPTIVRTFQQQQNQKSFQHQIQLLGKKTLYKRPRQTCLGGGCKIKWQQGDSSTGEHSLKRQTLVIFEQSKPNDWKNQATQGIFKREIRVAQNYGEKHTSGS